MAHKKKAGKRRRRASKVTIGALALRCLITNIDAADGKQWLVVDVDPVETRASGSVVHIGTESDCIEWLKAAPSGHLYLLAQVGAVKGLSK